MIIEFIFYGIYQSLLIQELLCGCVNFRKVVISKRCQSFKIKKNPYYPYDSFFPAIVYYY